MAPLLDDDDALEAIWKKCYSLTATTASDQFKSYEELENRMNIVLGLNISPTRSGNKTFQSALGARTGGYDHGTEQNPIQLE